MADDQDGGALHAWLAGLPTEEVPAWTRIMTAGETSGRVLILEDGGVEVLRDGLRIAEVTERGAIFGEISMLLKRPHTADVRTTRASTFRVVVGDRLFREGPGGPLYVATVLAARLASANDRLLEIQRKLEDDKHPPGTIAKMIETIGDALRFGPPL